MGVTIDQSRLNEEDRRFLLNRNLTEVIANEQGSLANSSMTLSLLALALAGFTIVYQTEIAWLILTFAIIALIGIIFYVSRYKKAMSSLELERTKLKLNYDELFKHHFAYAKKKEENKQRPSSKFP